MYYQYTQPSLSAGSWRFPFWPHSLLLLLRVVKTSAAHCHSLFVVRDYSVLLKLVFAQNGDQVMCFYLSDGESTIRKVQVQSAAFLRTLSGEGERCENSQRLGSRDPILKNLVNSKKPQGVLEGRIL